MKVSSDVIFGKLSNFGFYSQHFRGDENKHFFSDIRGEKSIFFLESIGSISDNLKIFANLYCKTFMYCCVIVPWETGVFSMY